MISVAKRPRAFQAPNVHSMFEAAKGLKHHIQHFCANMCRCFGSCSCCCCCCGHVFMGLSLVVVVAVVYNISQFHLI